MRLKKITLENFRCFKSLEIDLHPQMTVLVAENGQGKSSILDAIRIALWPFVSSFDLAKNSFNDPINSITIEDVRLERLGTHDMARQLPTSIATTGDFGTGSETTWIRYRDKEAQKSKTKDSGATAFMRQWAGAVQGQIRDPNKPVLDLPVFGYYGTGRLWSQKKPTALTRGKDNTKETDFYIRTFAYMNCLDPASTFKHFKEWFVWASFVLMETTLRLAQGEKKLSVPPNVSLEPKNLLATYTQLNVVRQTIDAILETTTGWHGLEYSFYYERSLILHHTSQGIMKVEALSDGIRSMLAMVGDIAYRCIKLNPHLAIEAARETEGIVLIDEIEMHLHPGWQQLVLGQLQAAFPKIQFVVTTHSPQVLTSVDASCIRKLRQIHNEQGQSEIVVEHVTQQTKGVASSDLMAEIMGVDPIPDLPEARDLSAYHALIQQNLHQGSEGSRLRAALEQHFGAEHPVMRDCERMIRLQAFKQKLPLPEFKPNREEEKPEGAQ